MLRLLALIAVVAVGVLAVPPALPDQYSAVVMMRMPYIPLEMPLRVVTSTSAQKIEYYDGLQVMTTSAAGTHKYVFNNSERVCMFSPPTAGPKQGLGSRLGGSFEPNKFLPDLSTYTQVADELIGGTMCQKFSLFTPHGTAHTMDDHSSFYWDAVLEKPVRWHMHSRLVPFGAHTDEYILDFLSFQAGAPAAAELALPKLCSEQPAEAQVSLGFEAYLKQHVKSSQMLLVGELNRKHAGQTTFKAHQFMGLTKEQIMSFRGGKNKGSSRNRRTVEQQKYVFTHKTVGAVKLPTDFDWRIERPGVVSAVKDQAFCGSCWTYGAMEPIESAIAIQTKNELVLLPEQFMVDCAWTNQTGESGSNSGCDGGDSDIGTLEIVRKFGGIVPSAKAYGSYLSVNGYCKDIRLMEVGARLTGWVDVPKRDDKATMEALVTNGPLYVGIQVPEDMLYYDTGVLTTENCKHDQSQIDHAVVLVGFGTQPADKERGTPSADYWLVRNSWSTYWGDQGYIKVARGANDCCVACEPGYPKVALSASSSVIV